MSLLSLPCRFQMGKILSFVQQWHWLIVADQIFNHVVQALLTVHRKSLLGAHVQRTSIKHSLAKRTKYC